MERPGFWLAPGGAAAVATGISKAMARSGVMRVCDSGMSSSCDGSCSSQRANQLELSSSSRISPVNQKEDCGRFRRSRHDLSSPSITATTAIDQKRADD
ncbi:hypothetical protein GW17_00041754 [Ensete ventricosum]|nr:hypothetical protein GW17_00041754 [Ensete ventricosum]